MQALILITNDDGYQASGIQALASAVASFADVYVVAPNGPRSGTACAITCTTPVTFSPVSPQQPSARPNGTLDPSKNLSPQPHWYSCSGTPVDCVKLALEQILPRRPDLILSGINHGDNASISAHYSGTIGAVFEGCMKGIPSVGVSLYLKRGQRYEDFPVGSDTLIALTRLCQRIVESGLPEDVCLNINLPTAHAFRGWQVCRQARGAWSAEWVSATHPFGQRAFWLTGTFTDLEPEAEDTDFSALRAGYCSIVPLHVDLTAHEAKKRIESLISTT